MKKLEVIFNNNKILLLNNFNLLKNIYVIKIINNNVSKLIILYDGLIYNQNNIKIIENDFSGNTIIYKLNLKNKMINHYLQ